MQQEQIQSDYAVPETLCEEFLRLLAALDRAISAQTGAVYRLHAATGRSDPAYAALREQVLAGADTVLQAPIELERHSKLHGCVASQFSHAGRVTKTS